jgi:hypothetical protein
MKLLPIVYDVLGCDPTGTLGTFRIIDTPDEVIDALVDAYLRAALIEVEEVEDEWNRGLITRETYRAFREEHYFLRYERYVDVVKKAERYSRAAGHQSAETDFLLERMTHAHKPNRAAWLEYLREANPDFYAFITKERTFGIPEEKLLNAYIVAASQSGKTELLKLFAHSIIKRKREALIFIEPAGDAARQIALWPECKDRLIYVDLSLDLERAPTINPFQIYGVRAEDTSPAALDVKTVVAQQLLTAFQEVLGTGLGAELSKNMQTIVMQCLLVLLDWPAATLRDLRRFMDDGQNADLVAFGRSRHHYPDVANFFTQNFHSKHYAPTKDAIQAKLHNLFSSGKFTRLTCGPSTFMLEKAVEERKIIIFNLAEGSVGELEGSAFGRLIVALLQGIAVRRDRQNKRVPTRVIIDEFHNFTTRSMEKIVTQAAKFKLYLLMAQQQIGQGTTKEISDAALNVSVLIGGRNNPKYHGPVASMLGLPPEAIGGLDRGDFIVHLSGVPQLQFCIKKHLLGASHRMSNEEWEQVKSDQLRRYYRPVTAPTPIATPLAEISRPRRDQVVPYQRREVAASEVTPLEPVQRGPVRRRKSFKAENVEITEEEEGIF